MRGLCVGGRQGFSALAVPGFAHGPALELAQHAAYIQTFNPNGAADWAAVETAHKPAH